MSRVYLTMDFPDLGAAVDMPKRGKMPRAQRSKGGGERRPKSALQSMLDGQKVSVGGAAAGVVGERTNGSAPVETIPVEVLADIGPPPKPVPEPDATSHQEATAVFQAKIDEYEKRVVCLFQKNMPRSCQSTWRFACMTC